MQYGVRKDTGRIDYDEVRDLAKKETPRAAVGRRHRLLAPLGLRDDGAIAREVGARFCADIAHIAGLVAGGAHPSPVPARRRGHDDDAQDAARPARRHDPVPRPSTRRPIDRAVFPGLQGGPHVHNTAALAVALHEAAQPAFKDYAQQVVANARALAEALIARGFDVVSGGTDNHLILVDLTNKNVSGKIAAQALDKAGHRAELQLGPLRHAQAVRSRRGSASARRRSPAAGMGEAEMKQIAAWMDRVIGDPDRRRPPTTVAGEVRELTRKFPAPGISA